MSKTAKTAYKCDLCGSSVTVNAGDAPAGWVSFEIENPMVERMWYDKCVCKSCRDEIIKKVNGK